MLTLINECVKVEGDWFLYFRFENTGDCEKVSFCGTAKLFRDYGQDHPILIGESEHSRVFYFHPPEGCNVRQSFEVLFWEVAKLAFAMTQGSVRYAAQSLSQHSDDTWTLPFLKQPV